MSIWIVWCLIGLAVLSVWVVMIRYRWRQERHSGGSGKSGPVLEALLDAHIATQWTEGRVRIGSLLALIQELRASLEQDVERLSRLDPSGAEYEREAHRAVEPNLRRFTFDKHLRNECRVLVPFLQFCGHDLADSRGWNTTEQLKALEDVQAAIGPAHDR